MNQREFTRRRRALMRMIGKESVAILPAAETRMRNRDVEYPFRQDSDFYYLTGFAEPSAVLVLVPGRPEGEVLLFCRERDPARAIWDGQRAGPEGAVADYGADEAWPVSELEEVLPGIVNDADLSSSRSNKGLVMGAVLLSFLGHQADD